MSVNAPGPSPSPSPSPSPRPGSWPAPPPRASDVLRSPQGLATALTVLLSAGAAVDLFSSGVGLYTRKLMTDYAADPASVESGSLDLSDFLTIRIGFAQGLFSLAIAVVFIIWFYRVRCNGQVFRPDCFSRSAGWAIGGWFIPIGNLFIPYRTARETWEASTPYDPDGTHRRVSAAPVIAWWLVFTASELLYRFGSAQYVRAETPEEIRDTCAFNAAVDLTAVVAAVLAVVFVRKLTALQRARAEELLLKRTAPGAATAAV
ncbi:conserved hypothetical protein [Streptomyces sp. Mg1]|uniref:DUF4328 domain-containing protein n=1 Tax=Streptomyces TaxID=1883 RepID=UPI00017E9735|nr:MULTISPECIES: DUF4328 domain-containing protein [Streptomyces]EDX20893.1 conserved hypothetical protein [Streptomyces sp. Mg1]WBY24460.1 DUF4328 domain-containing protein [Streptomyces goshikiensis]WSY02876.1 DUF4328 domain-containing protein [Streptomyces goshikiensis]